MDAKTDAPDFHVAEEAIAYFTGELDAARTEEVGRHLGQCRDCAAHFALVERIRNDVAALHAIHLRPDRLVALGETPREPPSTEERMHLESCPSCREEVSWAGSVPPLQTMEEQIAAEGVVAGEAHGSRQAEAPPPRPRRAPLKEAIGSLIRLPALRWGVAGLAVASLAFLLLSRPSGPSNQASGLVRLEALPTGQVTRGAQGTAEYRKVYRQAMESYASGDYARAEQSFLQATMLAPRDAAVQLYLGSARLLRGRTAQAVPALQRAVELADSKRMKEESRWELAEAYVISGKIPAAVEQLQEVIRLDSDRKERAETLLRGLGPQR